MITAHFSGRIWFLLQSNRLRIDTGTRRQNETLAFILQLNGTEHSLLSNSNQPLLLPPKPTTRWLVAIKRVGEKWRNARLDDHFTTFLQRGL